MFYYIDKDMLLIRYVVCFLVVNIICNEVIDFISLNVVKINDYLKLLCYKIIYIKSRSRCLGICEIMMDRIVMISYDEFINICMCCNDIMGSDKIGLNWKLYV